MSTVGDRFGSFPVPPYRGAAAGFATIHHKDRVVAPVLASLGLDVRPVTFDTDSLGTFSGEVPRTAPVLDVLRTKALAGATAAGRFGLGSEGTFAPDPALPVTIDTELVGLLDAESGVLVVGRSVAPAPWAVSVTVADTLDDAGVATLQRAGLPAQRMIVATAEPSDHPVVKDLADLAHIRRAIEALVRGGHRAVISSDLRADRSPGRRQVVEAAAHDLVGRLSTACPDCGGAGFGPESAERGLPCSWCDGPTLEVAARVHRCPSCAHEERVVVEGLADPGRCERCNP